VFFLTEEKALVSAASITWKFIGHLGMLKNCRTVSDLDCRLGSAYCLRNTELFDKHNTCNAQGALSLHAGLSDLVQTLMILDIDFIKASSSVVVSRTRCQFWTQIWVGLNSIQDATSP